MPEYTFSKLDSGWDAHVLKFRIWYLLLKKPEVILTPTEAIIFFNVALLAAEETILNTIMANPNAGIMPTPQAQFSLTLDIEAVNQAFRNALPGKKVLYIGVSHQRAIVISLDPLSVSEKTILRNTVNSLWVQDI